MFRLQMFTSPRAYSAFPPQRVWGLEMTSRLRHTLAFRLTLWYGGLFTISSCVVFLIFYVLITSFMREQADQDLLNQVRTISSVLSDQGVNAVEKIAILEAQAAGEKKIFIRLLSRSGAVFSSSNMSYWKNIAVEKAAIHRLLNERRSVFDTITIPARKEKVRILYSLISRNLILQLGQSLENNRRFIEAFWKIFVITISILIVVAALVGWFMARKALSKMAVVSRTAQEISGGALDKRVPVTQKGDEVDQLATTFNQMLDRIEKLISGIKEMSDNIAHDLKSPVTRIRGIAEITLTTGSSMQAYEEMSASIIEECDRLLDMINTMLVISKTEVGVDRLNIERFDITKTVQDAGRLFQSIAEDNGIEMACHLPGEIFIHADIRMIQRMIANLVDNAIRYTPSKGKIDVSVHTNDRENVSISIKDNGIGISEKDLPHIFERFYRCDPSRTQIGTGLGLSLARAVAQAHNGKIDVNSRVGKGTTFTVTFNRDLSSQTV